MANNALSSAAHALASAANQLITASAGAAMAGAASSVTGMALGSSAGQAVGAAGSLASGAAGMAAAGGPAGAAAAGLIALSAATVKAGESLKGFAAAASPDGLKFFDTAISILSVSIGSKLLPFFIELGATVVTVGEKLADDLIPTVGQTAQWFRQQGPVFKAFGVAVVAVTEAIIELAGKVLGFLGKLTNNPTLKDAAGAAADFKKARAGTDATVTPGKATGSAAPEPESESDKWDRRTNKNRELIMNELQKSMGEKMGAKGGVGGITDVWKKVQESAFGGGLEAKRDRMQLDMLKELRELNNKAGKTAQATGEVAGRPPVVKR